MLLAELEIWHSRPATPTRRVALGHLVLPVEPAPGFGGLLLAAVVAAHLPDTDPDDAADVGRLIDQVVDGQRIVQPRLAHRFQVDRHGLSVSVHRLESDGERVNVRLHSTGRPMAQVLGAVYAMERLDRDARVVLGDVLRRAMRWRGPVGPSFISDLAGPDGSRLTNRANPRLWARDVLGFEESEDVSRREVQRRFRSKLRGVHPDLGGSRHAAAADIDSLNEARRILLE